MAIQDDLDEEPDLAQGVRASLALDGLAGTWLGPRDPTTNGLALMRASVSDEVATDGASLVAVLAERARVLGVEVFLGSSLNSISLKDGHVDGVVVGNKRVACEAVLMTDGLGSLLDALPEFSVSPRLQHAVENVRSRGTVAVVRMGLKSPLTADGRCVSRARTALELDDLERAHDAVKYGRLPEVFPLDVRQWSADHSGLAPEGHHVVSVHVHGVPEGGDVSGEALVAAVMQGLAPYHDHLARDRVCVDVLRPHDLREVGIPGGHLWHAEMALDQLWATRPFGALAQHGTPWDGVYTASLANHPGTLALGSGGAHAARMMLASH
jgi:phytoene dehydrogenase-like protein